MINDFVYVFCINCIPYDDHGIRILISTLFLIRQSLKVPLWLWIRPVTLHINSNYVFSCWDCGKHLPWQFSNTWRRNWRILSDVGKYLVCIRGKCLLVLALSCSKVKQRNIQSGTYWNLLLNLHFYLALDIPIQIPSNEISLIKWRVKFQISRLLICCSDFCIRHFIGWISFSFQDTN